MDLTIWHEGLLYKLIQSGVGCKLYDIIKSMYFSSKSVVKIVYNRTDYFNQVRGVQQAADWVLHYSIYYLYLWIGTDITEFYCLELNIGQSLLSQLVLRLITGAQENITIAGNIRPT